MLAHVRVVGSTSKISDGETIARSLLASDLEDAQGVVRATTADRDMFIGGLADCFTDWFSDVVARARPRDRDTANKRSAP